MKNIPGTLLMVRRLARSKRGIIPGQVPAYIVKNGNITSEYHYLTYGEPCVLVSYLKRNSSYKNNLYDLILLWDNKIINVLLTNNNCNKWFVPYNTWVNSDHVKTYDNFLSNGEMERQWKLYNVSYRLET